MTVINIIMFVLSISVVIFLYVSTMYYRDKCFGLEEEIERLEDDIDELKIYIIELKQQTHKN